MERKTKTQVPILMYHGVTDNPALRPGRFLLAARLFAEQMALLAEAGYRPLTITQLVRRLSSGAIPERAVVITFDDAYDNFYTEALPILARYGFPATLYVPTAYVGDQGRLDWGQLQELSQQGIELGAHSHSHPELDLLAPSHVHAELVSCKTILEQHLKQEIASLAYPYGYYSASVRQIAIEAGYNSACAVRYTICKADSDPFLLPRLIVTNRTTVDRFAALLSGRGPMLHPAYEQPRALAWRYVRRALNGLKRTFPSLGGYLG